MIPFVIWWYLILLVSATLTYAVSWEESKEALLVSKYMKHPECCCNMLAGWRLSTGNSKQFFTAIAFRWSGTEQIIFFDFNICFIDMLMA